MPDMPWKEAIIRILDESESAMHYSDIATKIVEDGLRNSVGATPAATVNSYISSSLKDEGNDSPFIRVGRGEYFLRTKSQGSTDEIEEQIIDTADEQHEITTSVIHAFGMFWQRELVLWSSSPSLLGRQQIGADPVDFNAQLGVYLLHDGRDVVYVGRSIDRPLGRRLFEHTQDRLRGRWMRWTLLSRQFSAQVKQKMVS